MATEEAKRRAQAIFAERRKQGIPIGGPPVKVELKEGYVALAVTHADYYALMRILRADAEQGDTEAQRLIPVLRVEGLESSTTG